MPYSLWEWRPKWRTLGSDPDYRFTLANERTFLAWIRTALSLLAGGLLLEQLAHNATPRWAWLGLAVLLTAIGAAVSAMAYFRWRANEVAIRQGSPLPAPTAVPTLALATGLGAILILGIVCVAA